MKIGINIESFKSWERGTISWDTNTENLTSCSQAG